MSVDEKRRRLVKLLGAERKKLEPAEKAVIKATNTYNKRIKKRNYIWNLIRTYERALEDLDIVECKLEAALNPKEA